MVDPVQSRPSGRSGAVATAVVIPVKAFSRAKERLAADLRPAERERLARLLADRVVQAVAAMSVFIACDDPAVAEWAEARGAGVLWGPGLGLNGAVDAAVVTVADAGFERVLISHADLVLPEGLGRLGAERSSEIIIVPDRVRDGTNVIVRPTAAALPASYGAESFGRHLDAALATGISVDVRFDHHLSLDLDTRADLEHPLVRPVVRSLLDGAGVSP